MTIRKPVSVIHNSFYDGQRVDQVDMTVEQDRNVNKDASIVQNHFGSGILLKSFSQAIVFDTDDLFPDQVALTISNDFDGTGLRPLAQPSDSTLGNQLEVELTDSDVNGNTTVGGRLSSKVLIVGLDFNGELQYDALYFYKKEKQVTKKHYARILSVFFNDFYGNNNCSRNLGGRFIIRESASMQLSRDPIMISQDVEPNLFFRDFKISNVSSTGDILLTLAQAIQAGIGVTYNVDDLGINTTVKRNVYLDAGDVTTKIAQKFKAETNNIQKLTILLGVSKNTSGTIAEWFDWSGELVINVYELQSTVTCYSQLVPELAIEYDPDPEPILQFSLDKDDLEDLGYVLSDVLQPVDLVVSNYNVGSSSNPRIEVGKYYAISINRGGDSSTGILFTGVGNSVSDYSRLSIYSGGTWTDVSEEDLWFQVWTDAAKVSDGMAYDDGNGMQIDKTTENELGATIDYSFDQNAFSDNGQNTLNTAVLEAIKEQSDQEQDERTGNTVYSRQMFEPQLSFVTNTQLTTLRETTEPLVIGCARDTNAKSNSTITGTQLYPGLAYDNKYIVVGPDVSLTSQRLIGSRLIPDSSSSSNTYKIVKTQLCTDGYGDVNGDGVVDEADAIRVAQLIGESLELESTQNKILAGDITVLELLRADVDGDGYITSTDATLILNYVGRNINSFPVGSSFTHLEIEVQNETGRFDGYYDCGDGYIRLDGYTPGTDGYYTDNNIIAIGDLTEAQLKYYGYNGLPDLASDNVNFSTTPWIDSVDFSIVPTAFWQDYLMQFSSKGRLVPVVFTSIDTSSTEYMDSSNNCTEDSESICNDNLNLDEDSCEPGQNNVFIPDNLIMGSGQILNKNGNYYKPDIEVYPIVLELPPEIQFENAILDIFTKFVLDRGDGTTAAGYTAPKFADCTTVSAAALVSNQVRFDVSIQSIYPNFDGYTLDDGYGIIIDDIIGINIDQSTGIMTLSAKDIDHSTVYPELRTKILITVYLKKSGWNNTPLTVPYNQISGLFS